MNLATVRARVRAARNVPVLGAAVRAADRVWWYRVIRRSGLVDADFYSAQLGLGRLPVVAAIWHYVARGFRRGMSLNPLFDEIYAGGGLPEVFRVPALYAYLVGERATIPVHPWWDAVAMTGDDGCPGLERMSADPAAELTLRVGDEKRTLTVAAVRQIAISAACGWSRRGRGRRAAATPDAATASTRVVRFMQSRDRRYHLKLAQAARLVASGRASASIAFVGADASQWVSAVIFSEVVGGVSLERYPAHEKWADALEAEIDRIAGARMLAVIDPRAEFTDDDIDALATEAPHSLTIPAHRAFDGTIAGLGSAQVGPGRVYRILRGHPAEDAAAIVGRVLDVPLASGRTFAVDLSVYRDAGGVRPNGGEELEDLSRRLAPGGVPVRVLLDLMPVFEEPEIAFHRDSRDAPRAQKPVEADRRRAEAVISAAGFDVLGWRMRGNDSPVPELEWRRPAPGAQRWAIKICAPAGRPGAVWGDTHFARGLKSALERRGHMVVIDAFDARDRDTGYLDDASVVVRGPYRIDAPRWGVAMQWIISHPDEIAREEAAAFDRVFAASDSWSARAGARWGLRIDPLLEATDTDLFRPAGLPRGSDIVFVGTARGIPRPSVVVPLAAGIPVRVYGPDWRPFIAHSAIAAPTIANTDLPARYETASIVLNDQWPAMRREGFIAMRPFDAVAVGGRVVSESVDEIEEIFDGAVVAYRDADHLVELLQADPSEIFPSDERMLEISERIRRDHSFDARAAVLDAAATEARAAEPGRTRR